MIRFARDPSGRVAIDLGSELPGRGAWVSASRKAVEQAAAKGLFSRAFKAETAIAPETPSGLAERVAKGLKDRALAALGLCRRVGDVALGAEQVREAIAAGDVIAALIATDAADGGAEKIAKTAGPALVVRVFSIEDQSAALGRDKVVYAALRSGASAKRFLRELDRLGGFVDGDLADVGAPAKRAAAPA
jgi:hypothetical protein